MIDERAYLILEALHRRDNARFSDFLPRLTNPRTLSHKLTYLREQRLIQSDAGRYRLTAKGGNVFEALSQAMKALGREEVVVANVERIPHAVLAPVLARYVDILYQHFGERLLGLLVFGSLARGTWTRDSDIDLLLVVEGWREPLWERLRELWPLRNLLRRTPEYREGLRRGYVPVLQHYPLDREEARRLHRIYLDAAVEGIILYERQRFLSDLMARVRSLLRAAGAKRLLIPGKGHYWLLGEARLLEGL